tara:strand:+ start:552 stop:1241 length:690 start_codon:yes stop_codon:yes gene_type:complete
MIKTEVKKVLETILLCSNEPLSYEDIKKIIGNIDEESSFKFDFNFLNSLISEISLEWNEKGLELVKVSSGWRFQTKPEMKIYLDKMNRNKPPKYSRATLETLAIIAYQQPVTRGDIEEIRGVSFNSNALKLLEDRGWIDIVGHREVPGRPELLATTKKFLDDLGLLSLEDLPSLKHSQEKLFIGNEDFFKNFGNGFQNKINQYPIEFEKNLNEDSIKQNLLGKSIKKTN